MAKSNLRPFLKMNIFKDSSIPETWVNSRGTHLVLHGVDGDGEGGVIPFHLLFLVHACLAALVLGGTDPHHSDPDDGEQEANTDHDDHDCAHSWNHTNTEPFTHTVRQVSSCVGLCAVLSTIQSTLHFVTPPPPRRHSNSNLTSVGSIQPCSNFCMNTICSYITQFYS